MIVKTEKIENEANKPIFIIGMNGSGTTMLADCLNHHPDIYIHKVESRVIPYYAKCINEFGNLAEEKNFNDLLKDFSNNYAFRATNNSKKLDIHFDYQSLKHPTLSTAIHLTFSYYASKERKARWGDHSPKYALFIPEILDLFPAAKFIHIFRDGRDCAQSFRNRFRKNIYRTIQDWKVLVKKARQDGTKVGEERYHEVRYESLTADPEKHLKAICAFIEEPFDDRVLISRMPMFREKEGLATGQDEGTIVQNYGKWQRIFTVREKRRLESIAGQMLHDMGYDAHYEEGDRNLSRIRLKLLKVLDQINSGISFSQRYKGEDRLGTFFRQVSTSIKQGKTRWP